MMIDHHHHIRSCKKLMSRVNLGLSLTQARDFMMGQLCLERGPVRAIRAVELRIISWKEGVSKIAIVIKTMMRQQAVKKKTLVQWKLSEMRTQTSAWALARRPVLGHKKRGKELGKIWNKTKNWKMRMIVREMMMMIMGSTRVKIQQQAKYP